MMAHILIVDDEAAIRFLVRTVLESASHSVFEAQDGGTALNMLETYPKPFDMIILDLRMPKMHGFEFLSILQNRPIPVPVIILSAHSEQVPQALESVVSSRFLKPFRRQELNDTVNRLLGESTSPSYMEKRTETMTEYSLHGSGTD